MIKKGLFIFITAGLLFACSAKRNVSLNSYDSSGVTHVMYNNYAFLVVKYSNDKTYGYTEKNPIMVGSGSEGSGPENERRFLNALAGPNGEEISYYRIGSCCPFQTENSSWGGMLDQYQISYEGNEDGVVLYINMYDSDSLFIPKGFTRRL